MIHKDSLLQFKEYFDKNIGQEVSIKADAGRNKFLQKSGTIEGVYSNYFLIKDELNCNVCYSYSDLSNKLEVTFEEDGRIIGSISDKSLPKL